MIVCLTLLNALAGAAQLGLRSAGALTGRTAVRTEGAIGTE